MKKVYIKNGKLTGITVRQGESIEEKVARMTQNQEPINDEKQTIYTDRKNGVEPEYNIRTDIWEIGADGMTTIQKEYMTKRNSYYNPKETENEQNNGETESTQATE